MEKDIPGRASKAWSVRAGPHADKAFRTAAVRDTAERGMRVTRRETGSKHRLSMQSLESVLKAEEPATGGFEAGTRRDKGFGFFLPLLCL